MRRRDFIKAIAVSTTWPLAAHAQDQARTRRVVVLMGSAETASTRGWVTIFLRRLEELGWKEHYNLFTQVQWWNDKPEQMRLWAAELIEGSPDVAVTFTNPALEVVKPIAGKVPIVFVGIGDSVGSGYVSSLAHPGGNITGFESHEPSMGGKGLEVLKETAAQVTRVLAIVDAKIPASQAQWRSVEETASRLAIEATAGNVHNVAEIEQIITSFAEKPNGGLVVLPHALTIFNASAIIALAHRYRMPDVYALAEFAAAGGLVSYGLDWDDQFRRAAEYVDQILRGVKPADLPVQTPTKYQLVINLKTAKPLGLAVAQTLLARADEVIE